MGVVVPCADAKGRSSVSLPTDPSPFRPYSPWIALGFSVEAMRAASQRINRVAAGSPAEAFAAMGETLWWTSLVDDILKRRHPEAYELAAERQVPDVREVVRGLRSVRNRLGHEVDLFDFVSPIASRPDSGDGRITAWMWTSIAPSTRGRTDDVAGHRAYEAVVANRNVVHVLTDVVGFLSAAYANAQHGLP